MVTGEPLLARRRDRLGGRRPGGVRSDAARAGTPGGLVVATRPRLDRTRVGSVRRPTLDARSAATPSPRWSRRPSARIYLIIEPLERRPRGAGVPLGPVRGRGALGLEQPLVRRPPHARLQRPLPLPRLRSSGPAWSACIAVLAAALLFAGDRLSPVGRPRPPRRRSGSRPAPRSASSAAASRSRSGSRSRSPRSSPRSAAGARRRSASRSSPRSRARSRRSSWPAAPSPTRSSERTPRGPRARRSPRSAPPCSSTWAFPEGGTEPFVYSSFQPAILIAIAVFLAIPKEEQLLRYGVAAYAAALAGAFLIDSPMGGNATRMGALFLGPALAFGLWRRQQVAVLVLLAPLLIYWQWSPVVRDLETVYAQPSVDVELLQARPRLPARRHAADRASATGSRWFRSSTTGRPPTCPRASTSRAAGSASSTAS